jgi:Xaa-Pro aminopeptidase
MTASPAGAIHPVRRARAAALLDRPEQDELTLDALLVTNLHNVRYLTGFSGSNGALLLSHHGSGVLFTDPRYTVQSQRQVDCAVRIAKGPLAQAVLLEIRRSRARRVGFERDTMTVAQFETLEKGLPERTRLMPATGLIERLRMVKDAGEIESIRASVISNSRALEAALRLFKPGMTESDLAAEIDYRNRKFGRRGAVVRHHCGRGGARGASARPARRHEDRSRNAADRHGRLSLRLCQRYDADGACGSGNSKIQTRLSGGPRSPTRRSRCGQAWRNRWFG